jgi:hypothetical protein
MSTSNSRCRSRGDDFLHHRIGCDLLLQLRKLLRRRALLLRLLEHLLAARDRLVEADPAQVDRIVGDANPHLVFPVLLDAVPHLAVDANVEVLEHVEHRRELGLRGRLTILQRDAGHQLR